jgi:hypothetical protein
MIILAIVAVVTVAVVAVAQVVLNRVESSSPTVVSTDATEPVVTTSTAVPPAAVAPLPPGFPDLDGFTDMSHDHDVSRYYPLATFTSPTGLQCAMWSSRGDTAAFCFGDIPGRDHPANQVYAGDYESFFDQNRPPDKDKLNGKPLASGEKVILGAGGNLMGGDQITCSVQDLTVACMVMRAFRRNHGDDTAQRHGFVVSPQNSWTF